MCDLPWREPYWDKLSNRKHRRENLTNWQRSITRTLTSLPDEASQFDPNITDEDLARMLIESVNADPDSSLHLGTPIRSVCHKRTFYREMSAVIGACNGEMTPYLYVEYHNSGLVHGWPISESELRRKLT
jgi:hypothetical protein